MLCVSDFWSDVLIATVGPVATFVLGFAVAQYFVTRTEKRRREADMRDDLATEMYDVAGSLYFELQNAWRKFDLADTHIADRRRQHPETVDELDRVYALARRRGKMLEQRLLIYYKTREPALRWHRVMDLLSVRYYLLLVPDRERRLAYREKNKGPQHTGLSVEELNDPKTLLAAYRSAIPEAVASLWRHELDWRGKHIRTSGDVATWSETLSEPADDIADDPPSGSDM